MNPILAFSRPEETILLTGANRDKLLAKTHKKEKALAPLTIVKSSISLYSWEQMQLIGSIKIENGELSGCNSVNDERMGVVSLNQACAKCSQIDCPGHYGSIDFKGTKIYNPAFIRQVVSVLICVCNDCGSLLISEDLMREKGFMRLKFDKRLAEMESYCMKQECLAEKPRLEGGSIKPCKRNDVFINTDISEKGEIVFRRRLEASNNVDPSSPISPKSIEKVYKILDKISDDVSQLLGFSLGSHPRNMILRGILVPPVIARPPVYEGGTINYDQLTNAYVSIYKKSSKISSGAPGEQNTPKELYTSVKELIFKTEKRKKGSGAKDFLSVIERIQGKNALLRALLMGKRNNFCGRTVAGPDPSLKYGQIRIPRKWAPILTKKVTVTDYNKEVLLVLLREGGITHVTSKETGLRKYCNPEKKSTLQVGERVERYLQDGDRVVVNRQPTLHKQSMMAYEVKLGYQDTIGLHLSYTSPMNCDFDGDEVNVWCPQDLEVEAEVEELMNVKNNIMSLEQNKPIMGLVMNSITGAFLLSEKNTRINDDLFKELLSLVIHQEDLHSLYFRLQKYGVHPRSGAAIFSATLPKDFYYNRGKVLIIEGVLVSGQLTKSHVGASHRSIIQELHKKYGPQRTSDFFTDAPWIINKWLIERGFSVGLLDVINLTVEENTGEEYDKNQRVMDEELAKIYVEFEALGGKLDDTLEETMREKKINNLVNVAEGVGKRLAKETLSGNNSIGVMSDQGAGTKGGIANIGQMMGCVGQQYYHSQRLKPTLTGGKRLLPTQDLNDINPEARGFIPQSFFKGLTPEGLFFLQAAGREGILDTALKTSETGSMQHRMIKAFENIVVGYDGSIRNTMGTMFSPMYNSGYSINEMVSVEAPGKKNISSFMDIKSTVTELNSKRGWVLKEVNENILLKREEVAEQLGEYNETLLPTPDLPKQPPTTETAVSYNINEPVPISHSPNKITKFEKARIVGARAIQISNNSPPMIDIGEEMDPAKIALMEYELGLIKIYVIRRFPMGDVEKIYPTLENI